MERDRQEDNTTSSRLHLKLETTLCNTTCVRCRQQHLHVPMSRKGHLRERTEGGSSAKGWLVDPSSLFLCGLRLGTQSDWWLPAFQRRS